MELTAAEKKWLVLVLRDNLQDGADVAEEDYHLYESIMNKLKS